ncbi:unnamed protein product [Owenia fusiformis]|uniref:Uncharacterized protein n=1 Tax=Owenia fusiformis TaxID=6347 RepID=A0A8S4N3F4_OWEFU|nr:unnamed protein product [Owenia fusiformis]
MDLKRQILQFFESHPDESLQALDLKHLGQKKDINHQLYALQKEGVIEKVQEAYLPLWKLISQPMSHNQDGTLSHMGDTVTTNETTATKAQPSLATSDQLITSQMKYLDPSLKNLFDQAGISADQLQDKETASFIYDFIEQQGGLDAVRKETAPPPPTSRNRRAPPPPPPSRGLQRGLGASPPPAPSRSMDAPPQPPPLSQIRQGAKSKEMNNLDLNNLDPSLKSVFDQVGISAKDLQDKETATFIYDFIKQQGGLDAVRKETERGCSPATFKPVKSGMAARPPPPSRNRGAPLPPPPGRNRAVPPPPPSSRGLQRSMDAPPPPASSKGMGASSRPLPPRQGTKLKEKSDPTNKTKFTSAPDEECESALVPPESVNYNIPGYVFAIGETQCTNCSVAFSQYESKFTCDCRTIALCKKCSIDHTQHGTQRMFKENVIQKHRYDKLRTSITKNLLGKLKSDITCTSILKGSNVNKVLIDEEIFGRSQSAAGLAIICGHKDILQYLLENYGTSLFKEALGTWQKSLGMLVIQNPQEDLACLSYIDEFYPDLIRKDFGNQHTGNALHVACSDSVSVKASVSKSHLKQVNYLIAQEFDLNAKDSSGNTPLHNACKITDPSIVETLLTHGANSSAENHEMQTPLFHLMASIEDKQPCHVMIGKNVRKCIVLLRKAGASHKTSGFVSIDTGSACKRVALSDLKAYKRPGVKDAVTLRDLKIIEGINPNSRDLKMDVTYNQVPEEQGTGSSKLACDIYPQSFEEPEKIQVSTENLEEDDTSSSHPLGKRLAMITNQSPNELLTETIETNSTTPLSAGASKTDITGHIIDIPSHSTCVVSTETSDAIPVTHPTTTTGEPITDISSYITGKPACPSTSNVSTEIMIASQNIPAAGGSAISSNIVPTTTAADTVASEMSSLTVTSSSSSQGKPVNAAEMDLAQMCLDFKQMHAELLEKELKETLGQRENVLLSNYASKMSDINEMLKKLAVSKYEPILDVVIEKVKPDDLGMRQLSKNLDEVYKMTSKPRGRALIINNEDFSKTKLQNRDGSTIDRVRLETLLRGFDFEVETLLDKTAQEINDILEDERRRHDHHYNDAFILVILSHGTNKPNSCVYGVDGAKVPINTITSYFEGKNCPDLKGKPKLFFMAACQGNTCHSATDYANAPSPDESQMSEPNIPSIPDTDDGPSDKPHKHTKADMLVACASVEDYVSFRDEQLGTWFIYHLVKVFGEEAHQKDINKLLTKVKRDVANRKTPSQKHIMIPNIPYNTLVKELYFFPGIVGTSGVTLPPDSNF